MCAWSRDQPFSTGTQSQIGVHSDGAAQMTGHLRPIARVNEDPNRNEKTGVSEEYSQTVEVHESEVMRLAVECDNS